LLVVISLLFLTNLLFLLGFPMLGFLRNPRAMLPSPLNVSIDWLATVSELVLASSIMKAKIFEA
jgi:hypothetical protein